MKAVYECSLHKLNMPLHTVVNDSTCARRQSIVPTLIMVLTSKTFLNILANRALAKQCLHSTLGMVGGSRSRCAVTCTLATYRAYSRLISGPSGGSTQHRTAAKITESPLLLYNATRSRPPCRQEPLVSMMARCSKQDRLGSGPNPHPDIISSSLYTALPLP
jgi:hypothetical protein